MCCSSEGSKLSGSYWLCCSQRRTHTCIQQRLSEESIWSFNRRQSRCRLCRACSTHHRNKGNGETHTAKAMRHTWLLMLLSVAAGSGRCSSPSRPSTAWQSLCRIRSQPQGMCHLRQCQGCSGLARKKGLGQGPPSTSGHEYVAALSVSKPFQASSGSKWNDSHISLAGLLVCGTLSRYCQAIRLALSTRSPTKIGCLGVLGNLHHMKNETSFAIGHR